MRIFVVARGYPTDAYKLNGIFEFDQAKALKKMGHEVIYLALDLRSIRRKRKWGMETKCIDDIVIEVMNIPCGRIPDSILYTLGKMGLKKLYANTVEKYGVPDIVHSHFTDISYITIETLKSESCLKVITEHSSAIHNNQVSIKNKKRYENAYKQADKVIAVSGSLANVILKEYGVKCSVIPNIVNVVDLCMNRNADIWCKEEEQYTFVSIGRLTTEKGMVNLVKGFVSCFKEDSKVQLIIIGDGKEKKEIQEIIKKNGMESQIFLYGVKSRGEIGCILDHCDCFVLASMTETFGVVFAEAMSFGIPVIGTKCGGPEDFVDEETGILIKVNDEDALKNALYFMKENSKKIYDRDIIKSKINHICSEKVVGKQLENLYNELLIRKERRNLS